MTKLEEARKRYPGMPASLEYLPKGKRVIIYRLDGEEKTAGGLYVPEEHREVRSRGVLMAAGLAAMDELHDALIEIGDEVCIGRFAGDDRELKRREGSARVTILECFAEDIAGSVDAVKRSENYDVVRSDGDDGYEYGEHRYEPRQAERRKGRAA